MNLNEYYTDFCTGCGLCHSKDVLFEEKDGFDYPVLQSKEQIEFCKAVCPVNAYQQNSESKYNGTWGAYVGVYRGWSKDAEMRYAAASGGVISTILTYALDHNLCDAVLHIGSDGSDPFAVKLYMSYSRDEVISHAASRYISGLTYRDLDSCIQPEKKYAVVGKPCDIEALINYLELNPELKKQFVFKITFFCAGSPSRNASVRLADSMGVAIDNISSFRYRGNGWPGKATVVTHDGEEHKMNYIDSWNKYLGRDIRKMCKFCMNGIGKYADISCGDLWKLNEDKKPNFADNPGQNIVFARTSAGDELLRRASREGYLHLEDFKDMKDLQYIQPNHYNMQTRMLGKIIGLRLCGGGYHAIN